MIATEIPLSSSQTSMRLSHLTVTQVGRLLNGTNNPQAAAIGHLATAAARAAESLMYLADLDDRRFRGNWPDDEYPNDTVDDAHVRWAATGALTSIDLCTAAAARLGGFALPPPNREVSIRDYFSTSHSGKVADKRHLVVPPWRAWIDGVVADARYEKLLRVRHALVHADALRIIHGTTGPIEGHALRYGYNVGPLRAPDRDPNGTGPFGLSEANPIPVNGPIGELAYLSKLETVQGERLLFHRIGSVGTIDVFEAVTFSGSEWFIFFVDFYHPRRSRVTPDGFRFSKDVSQFSGFHRFCKNFPYDFVEMKQSGEDSGLSLAYIAIGKVSQQIQNGAFKRPLAHKAKLDIVKGRLTSSKTQ